VEFEEMVDGARTISPSPIGPLHGAGWNDAIRCVLNRLAALKSDDEKV